jgi:outer membrane biosynthesis protein TonB
MNIEDPRDEEPPPLLSTLPLGGLLAALLRLLLPAERREEFLGDLIEEGHVRLRAGTRADLARWMWSQALGSAPALVSWRLRRLVLAPRAQALVVAGRGARRGLPVSLAVSVSAHALLLAGVLAVVLSRVEELDPGFIIDHSWTVFTDPSALESEPSADDTVFPRPLESVPQRRMRIARRPIAPSRPLSTANAETSAALPFAPDGAFAPGPPTTADTGSGAVAARAVGAPSGARGSGNRGPDGAEPRLRLPPRVVEKRCLSCPTPQLPHPYARLGIGQEMLVQTCVGTRGDVTSVRVLRGFDPIVDERVKETIRRWQLTPYSLDGHPVPFCYTTRFLFTTH